MKHQTQKIIGWLILILLVLPLLYGAILGIGVTQGALSPKILADLPKQIVQKVPGLVERVFVEAQKPGSVEDPEAKIWIEAAAGVETTPKEILVESGILPHLETEFTQAFTQLGEILRGQTPPKDIRLDLKPVKQGLRSRAFETYIRDVFENLPLCTRTESARWIVALESNEMEESIPACQPESVTIDAIVARIQTASELPDSLPLTEGLQQAPVLLGPTALIATMAPVLFLIPILLLVLGVMLAASTAKSRLQVAGTMVVIAGGLALITALIVQKSVLTALTISPAWTVTRESQFSPEFEQYLVKQFAPLAYPVVKTLFDPVLNLSVLMLVLGLIVIGLSLILSPHASPVSPAPTKSAPPVLKRKASPKGKRHQSKKTASK